MANVGAGKACCARERAQGNRGARTRRPRPPDRFGLDPHDHVVVVAQRDDEVVEVVLQIGDHQSRLDRHDPDPAAVGVGVEIEIGPV